MKNKAPVSFICSTLRLLMDCIKGLIYTYNYGQQKVMVSLPSSHLHNPAQFLIPFRTVIAQRICVEDVLIVLRKNKVRS